MHSTRVAPNETRQEPSAYGATRALERDGTHLVVASSGARQEVVQWPRRRSIVEVVECPGVSGTMTTVSAPAAHVRRADDRRFGIVAALHQHVGTERIDRARAACPRRTRRRRRPSRARRAHSIARRAADRALRALESLHRCIAVHADDERVARARARRAGRRRGPDAADRTRRS